VTRRAATGGGEIGEGEGEACRWLGKPDRNKSNLYQIKSKTLKATRTKENATTERGCEVEGVAWLLLKLAVETIKEKK
jgi:hypothetical protein